MMRNLEQKLKVLCCGGVLTASLLWPTGGFAQSNSSPLLVGAIVSATGPLALLGQAERDGIRLAEKVVNERGGIDGRPLRIIVEDDNSNPDTAVAKANALIGTSGLKAILGGSALAQSLAIGAVTDRIKFPQIAMTGLGPESERSRRCVFHIAPSQELNARGFLEYAANALKVKRVGVLHDTGFGQAVSQQLQLLASEYGIAFTGFEKFEIGATDTTTQAAKIRATNPEAVFIAATSTTAFRNAKQVGINVPLIAGFAVASYEAAKAIGDASSGVVFNDFVVAENPLEHQAQFVKLFESEYRRRPKSFDSLGWDAVNVLVEALKGLGKDPTKEQICESLRAQRHQGIFASYSFSAPDLGGITVNSINYSRYSDGSFDRLPFKPSAK